MSVEDIVDGLRTIQRKRGRNVDQGDVEMLELAIKDLGKSPEVVPLFIQEVGGGWLVCDRADNKDGMSFCMTFAKVDDTAIAEFIAHARSQPQSSEDK